MVPSLQFVKCYKEASSKKQYFTSHPVTFPLLQPLLILKGLCCCIKLTSIKIPQSGSAATADPRQRQYEHPLLFVLINGYKPVNSNKSGDTTETLIHPYTFLMDDIHDHLNHAEHNFMMRIINIVNLGSLAISGKCILCQVIGTDTKEIHFLGQQITRSLDHHPLFHLSFKRNSLFCKIFLHSLHNSLNLFTFVTEIIIGYMMEILPNILTRNKALSCVLNTLGRPFPQ